MTQPALDPTTTRAIDLQVEVKGTPEEVWETIATGPGITGWFVPSSVDGRLGGTVTMTFGPGMDESGPITVWEPPRRLMYSDGSGRNLAYEFTVEARDGGICTVRLVNSGFGAGTEWDGEIESMTAGWKLFLTNLALVHERFAGQPAASVMTMGMATGSIPEAFATLTASLGLPANPAVGERIAVSTPGLPLLAGTVVRTTGTMMTLLVDAPSPGTAFLAAEPYQGSVLAHLYIYQFGDAAIAALRKTEPAWQAWMSRTFAPMQPPAAIEPAADQSPATA